MQVEQPAENPAMFWLKDGEFPSGPYTKEQLKSLVTAGKASAASYVCLVDGNEWRKLSDALEASQPIVIAPVTISSNPLDRTVVDGNDAKTAPNSISASTTSAADGSGAWLKAVAKVAGPALIGYLLIYKPWRTVVKPITRPNSAVQYEEQRALRAEYEGRLGDATKHRKRAQEEQAFEEWKLRHEK